MLYVTFRAKTDYRDYLNGTRLACPRHGGPWGDDITCEDCTDLDGNPRDNVVKVPKLSRSHVDLNALRSDREFGMVANSDLLLSALQRAVKRAGVTTGYLVLSELPDTVTVDRSQFLARVQIDISQGWR